MLRSGFCGLARRPRLTKIPAQENKHIAKRKLIQLRQASNTGHTSRGNNKIEVLQQELGICTESFAI